MNNDKEKLSDDDLRKKMDFDRFLSEYKSVPVYKSKKFYGTILVAAVLIVVTWFLWREEVETPSSNKPSADKKFIHPPIEDVNIADSIFVLNGSIDTVLNYSNSTNLHVPSFAFLDQKGNVIKGEVSLHFRELHDVADFFVSGIPMSYDSAGAQLYLDCAGMFEIDAFRNGEMLYLNPEQPIKVQMSSVRKENSCNIYYLDTLVKKWKYMSNVIFGPSVTQLSPPLDLLKIRPPVKASSDLPRFDIAFDKTLFPELMIYDGVSFQLGADERYYDPKLAMKEWDHIKVERMVDGIHYIITFINPGDVHSFRVQPVFSGADYSRARSLYEEKTKARSIGGSPKNLISQDRKGRKDSISTKDHFIIHQFIVSRFGIWSLDCPKPLPNGKKIAARFVDLHKRSLELERVYLAEQGKNVMFTFSPDHFQEFCYNPDSKNILWALTKENSLVILNPNEFENIRKDKDSACLTLKPIEEKISSVAQFRKLLGL
jgi:hypothetical protein